MTDFPTYPTDPQAVEVQAAADQAVDWALTHGLCMKPALPKATTSAELQQGTGLATHAPFALFPSPFPSDCFQHALTIQPYLNQLFHAIANDHAFLEEHLQHLTHVDDFTARLFRLYLETRPYAKRQPITLAFHRSDYLLHSGSETTETVPQRLALHQVEFNTISVSFSSLGNVVSNLHRYLWDQPTYRHQIQGPASLATRTKDALLPPNDCIQGLPEALGRAWELYGNPQAAILMIVQPGERNIFDQRFIEYALQRDYHVTVLRKTLAEVHDQAAVDPTTYALRIQGHEIAVAYYRSAYSPTDFRTEQDWQARALVEQSKAIKCPNVAYQLAGTKKIQEVLSRAGVLERFVQDPQVRMQIQQCFTGLYPLDQSPEGRQAYQLALAHPERFVMKPQREGGGNNVYGRDIPPVLQSLSEKDQAAYILMDLIQPPELHNVLVHQGKVQRGPVISELGIFGTWLSQGNRVILNKPAGHLLRTKVASSNEGGIAAGFGVIDSPLLI
ncbi:Glutathione synthetase [Dispira parvispora]|uniref:Glutathione synthetase n=1 Tax=Dispira parvispora TaxID=1520584 RepID=A0A9W8ATX6_9FUNG|nr:Glutathione synthetase [Dispira parvispora]